MAEVLKNQTEKGNKKAYAVTKGGVVTPTEAFFNGVVDTPPACSPYGPNPAGTDPFPIQRPSGGFKKSKLATGMNQKGG